MAPTRRKRSISLPPDLDDEIQVEAKREGVTYSRWLADAARRELKVRAGLEAVAEVERRLGAFTGEELAEADEWAREAIERAGRSRSAPRRAA
jgi:hypothetical protein